MRLIYRPLAFLVCCLIALAYASKADAQAPADPAAKVLPDVNLQGGSVEDLIDLLRKQDSSLQIVVARDADAPTAEPDIHLKLKNVTVADVLKVLPVAYPGIDLVPANDSPIMVIKVHSMPAPAGPAQVVRVYSLYAGVEALKQMDGSGNDKALADALSLIQAALVQTSVNPPPTIQVHEATMALIVKATADQQDTVVSAIRALQGNSPPASTTRTVGAR